MGGTRVVAQEQEWQLDENGLLLPEQLQMPYETLIGGRESLQSKRLGIQRAYQRLRSLWELPVVFSHLVQYPDALDHLSCRLLVKAFYLAEKSYKFWPPPKEILDTVAEDATAQADENWGEALTWLLTNLKRHGYEWKDKEGEIDWDSWQKRDRDANQPVKCLPPIPAPTIPPALEYVVIQYGNGEISEGMRKLMADHPFFYKEWPYPNVPRNARIAIEAELRSKWDYAVKAGYATHVDNSDVG